MNRKMLFLSFIAIFVLFIFSTSPSEAASTMFSRTYGGTDNDAAQSVVQTSDGGYAIAGSTRSFGAGGSDFWLVRTDSMGNTEWNRTYGGEGEDVANSVIQTSDNGYALAGRSAFDLWVVKTDSAGNMQWNKTYGSSDGSSEASSIMQTGDGGYAIAGYTNFVPSVGGPFWLVKTDSDGNVQWNKTYGVGSAWSMVKTSDGCFALAGTKLVITDAEGNMQWNRTLSESGQDQIYSLVQTIDGGFALAGVKESSNGGGNDFWLVKTDETGTVPEFPYWVLLPLLMVATSIAYLSRRRHSTVRQ